MPLFQIGVTFFEYAAWLYSGMSAVPSVGSDPTNTLVSTRVKVDIKI